MNNLAHWQDDIDDALGGEFDGSLSGLCIMSLSFDITRNGVANLSSSRDGHLANTGSINHQTKSNELVASNSGIKSTSLNMNNEVPTDASNNCFKRFKPSISENGDENRASNQNKMVRQLQHIKNCLNISTSNATIAPYAVNDARLQESNNPVETDIESDRSSSPSSDTSSNQVASPSSTSDTSRSSTIDARSPSPQNSCSTNSSRSSSPTELRQMQSTNGKNISTTHNQGENVQSAHSSDRAHHSKTDSRAHQLNDNQQVSIYSARENLHSGSTLKESSFTTSVITTTAPMHFKSLHHPFSLKQFSSSPYHQFSNSSLNHDFYDRYLSHDSHQPLQTPLIGIERTQDFLALKLPPHGPEEIDSQRFTKEWSFEEPRNETAQIKGDNCTSNYNKIDAVNDLSKGGNQSNERKKDRGNIHSAREGFPFNYKRNSTLNNENVDQHEPIDLNVSYDQQDGCCDGEGGKHDVFSQSMKHFNPDRVQQSSCCDLRNKNGICQENDRENDEDNAAGMASQYHGQDTMFGTDANKQKFQYVLAAPISVATKTNEDTMTYLNQGQAYEIKLENTTDVAEAKKGFMCSIINIGFHERHMQQAENELWQQWSQQHPNEKIFSVDMKLSYNVFGVESDGLNKYEFLWDSSKAAGVFIRINSISTEFTPKKHGGEKGVPFKLSIETFSYNSKTHDSYFISAACSQIKVFKPKGAERKLRSDRDKISKRPTNDQDKYHRPTDHTIFKDCSLTSLHPMADGSLCYYRHSHGHFASKQIVTATNPGTPANSANQSAAHRSSEEGDSPGDNHTSSHNQTDNQTPDQNQSNHVSNDSEMSCHEQNSNQQRSYQGQCSRSLPLPSKGLHTDYSTNRLISEDQYIRGNNDNQLGYGPHPHQQSTSELTSNHNDLIHLPQPSSFNQVYHNNQARSVSGLSLSNQQHFSMAYYGHTLPSSIPPHIPPPISYGPSTSASLTTAPIQLSSGGNIPASQHINNVKYNPSVYRQMNQEKHSLPSHHNTSFKASNLPLIGHNNFQTYAASIEVCAENSPNEVKDTLNPGNYNHETYDTELHHAFNSLNQPFRSRRASTSLTTANSHTSGYMNQNRSQEHYSNSNMIPSENISNTTNWAVTTQLQGSNPNCSQKGINSSHDQEGNAFESIHNCGCSNQFNSQQSSPNKNSSECSSSSQTRYKNNNLGQLNAPTIQRNLFGCKYDPDDSRITVDSFCSEVVSWLSANRFGVFIKTFSNFSGSDLLRLTRTELIEICGLLDGIRLYNSLHGQPIQPKRKLYICLKMREVFHPIYLYDVTLKELLRELNTTFSSYIIHCDNRSSEAKHKSTGEKMASNSSSSSDSRSSIGGTSNETGAGDTYDLNARFFAEHEAHQRQRKSRVESKCSEEKDTSNMSRMICRLLIEGLTSVKIVATEQVVQMLEDESMWTIGLNIGESGLLEACISLCNSRQTSR